MCNFDMTERLLFTLLLSNAILIDNLKLSCDYQFSDKWGILFIWRQAL